MELMVMMISNQDKKLFYDEIWSSCSLEKEEGGRGKQIKLCFVSNFTDDGRCKAAKSNVFIQKKHLVHRGWRLVNIPHPGWWLAQGYEDFLHPFHYPDKFCHTKSLLHKSQGLYISFVINIHPLSLSFMFDEFIWGFYNESDIYIV